MACMCDASRIGSISGFAVLFLGTLCYMGRAAYRDLCRSKWPGAEGRVSRKKYERKEKLLPKVASPESSDASVPTKGVGPTAAAALKFPVTPGGLDSVADLIKTRLHLSNGAPQLGDGVPEAVPPSGRYFGKYEERGKMKHVKYNLEFLKDGSVYGGCEDDDGSFQVVHRQPSI
ncbi:unnamed protein product [Ostreobium quekettii]|uniref:Uncharacterized protein n=1 Tax=Ostreobium quekettii TaxID=121088 RepID=A0A8S1IYH5_9CHLO|nr:unnamed protein product [Ostreobium quekettii]|eukprot:evm.model.scf_370.4 EVM.evm.TU.scf_370.4   scf_370:80617-82069(-)